MSQKGQIKIRKGNTRFNFSDERLNAYAKDLEDYTARTDFPLIGEFEAEQRVFSGHVKELFHFYPTHEKLVLAYHFLKAKQKTYLIRNGLKRKIDIRLSKFLLGCCHGLTETKHVVSQEAG